MFVNVVISGVRRRNPRYFSQLHGTLYIAITIAIMYIAMV